MEGKLTKVSFSEVVPGRLFAEVTVTATEQEVKDADFKPLRQLVKSIRAVGIKVLKEAGIGLRRGRTYLDQDKTGVYYFVVGGKE